MKVDLYFFGKKRKYSFKVLVSTKENVFESAFFSF